MESLELVGAHVTGAGLKHLASLKQLRTLTLRSTGVTDAEILLVPNGSPYEVNKDQHRIDAITAARGKETGLPVIYLNRVGGQDELVFDGASFILSDAAEIVHRLPEWDEALALTHWTKGDDGRWTCAPVPKWPWPASLPCSDLPGHTTPTCSPTSAPTG